MSYWRFVILMIWPAKIEFIFYCIYERMSVCRLIDKHFLPEIATIIKSYMPMEITKIDKIGFKCCIVYDDMIVLFGENNVLTIFDVYTGDIVKTFGEQPFGGVRNILCNGDKIFVTTVNYEINGNYEDIYIDYIIYVYDIPTGKRDILYNNDGELLRSFFRNTEPNSHKSYIRQDIDIDFRECPVIVGRHIVVKCTVRDVRDKYMNDGRCEYMKKVLLLPIDKKTNRKNEISSIRPQIHAFGMTKNKKFYYSVGPDNQFIIHDNITDKELYKNKKNKIIEFIDPNYQSHNKYYIIRSISEDSSFIIITSLESACRKTKTCVIKIFVFDIKSNKVIYTTTDLFDFVLKTNDLFILTTSGQLIYISMDTIKIVNIHSKKEIGSYTLALSRYNGFILSLSNDENILVISYNGDIILCHIGNL